MNGNDLMVRADRRDAWIKFMAAAIAAGYNATNAADMADASMRELDKRYR